MVNISHHQRDALVKLLSDSDTLPGGIELRTQDAGAGTDLIVTFHTGAKVVLDEKGRDATPKGA